MSNHHTPEQIAKCADLMAKSSAVYAFRNGPVESMHACGQLSENDMMVLNKNMADRLGEIFYLLLTGRIDDLRTLFLFPSQCAVDWDPIDLSGLEENIRSAKELETLSGQVG